MAREAFIGEAYCGHDKPQGAVIEHLIQGMLPRRGLTIIVGEAGKGKSLTSIHLIKCLASGERFIHSNDAEGQLGMPLLKGGAICLPGEAYNTYFLRLEAAFFSLTEQQQEELCIWGGLPVVHLHARGISLREHFEAIKEKIRAKVGYLSGLGFPPAIVIIDTLSSAFFFSSENDPAEAQAILDELSHFAECHNCLIVLLAHPSKGTFAKAWEVRGSSVWNGAADVVWLIRQKNRIISLKVSKGRDGFEEGETFYFEMVGIGRSIYLQPISVETQAAATPKSSKPRIPTMRDKVLEVIKAMHAEGIPTDKFNVPMRLEREQGNLKRNGELMPAANFARTVKRAIQELAELGLIVITNDNGYERITLPVQDNTPL